MSESNAHIKSLEWIEGKWKKKNYFKENDPQKWFIWNNKQFVCGVCLSYAIEEFLIDIYVWEWNDDVNDDLEK
jgi:hypothetical protein